MPHPPQPSTPSRSACEIAHKPGMLGAVASAIGEAGGTIGAVDLISVDDANTLRDITVAAGDQDHWEAIVAAIDACDGAVVIDTTDRTFLLHVGGKIEQRNKHPLRTRDDLSMAYTPGVARVCKAIEADPKQGLPVHDQAQHGRRRVRRDRRARPGRHRPRGGACPSWRARRCCSRSSPASTPSRSAWTRRTRTRSCARSSSSRPPSAASTSRTSRRRAALRSRSA